MDWCQDVHTSSNIKIDVCDLIDLSLVHRNEDFAVKGWDCIISPIDKEKMLIDLAFSVKVEDRLPSIETKVCRKSVKIVS